MSRLLAGGVVSLLSCLGQAKAERYGARLISSLKNARFLKAFHEVETDMGVLRFQGADVKNIGNMLESERRDWRKFASHEQEVRFWIRDYLKEDQIFWDIGANVGMFTLYAALRQGVSVHAFEPYVPVLMELTQSIQLNPFRERVRAYGIAIGPRTSMERLRLHEAIALQGQGWRGIEGEVHKDVVKQPHSQLFASDEHTLGFFDIPAVTMDDACRVFGVPQPHHVKIDVDGLEVDLVTKGGKSVLSQLHTLMVEVELENRGRLDGELVPFLNSCGLVAVQTETQKDIEAQGGYAKNRLFVRASMAR